MSQAKNSILSRIINNGAAYKAMIVTIALAGFFFRLRQYLANRSLWVDEARLANNILERSVFELIKSPLLFNQAAPPGFLVFEKLTINAFGNTEYSFRLFPFIVGCLSIPLMYWFSVNIGNKFIGIISVALFSITPQLIYYTSETKQYSSDVFLLLFLSILILFCLKETNTIRNLITLGVTGIIAIWFSNPVTFVLFGAAIILAIEFLRLEKYKNLIWLTGISALWAVNFAVEYFMILKYSASNNYLVTYWQSNFAPLPPWIDFNWYIYSFRDLLVNPIGLPVSLLTVSLIILGILSVGSRRWSYLMVLLMPLLLALLASAFKKYPFSGRLMLFIVPLVLILAAEGLDFTCKFISKYNNTAAYGVALLLTIYLVFQPLSLDIQNSINPVMPQHVRPIFAYFKKNMTAKDSMYVYYDAEPAYKYYSNRFDLSFNKIIIGTSHADNPLQYLDEIDQFKGTKRLWLFFSNRKLSEQTLILNHLNTAGHSLLKINSIGSSAFLYDLSQ